MNNAHHTIEEVLNNTIRNLGSIYPVKEAQSISYILFEHLLNYTKTKIILHKQDEFPTLLQDSLARYLEKLKQHVPIQYVLGEAFFLDSMYKVAPGVLIPRSETEELVYWIQEVIKPDDVLWDIGTGSGCIPISLAASNLKITCYASDFSEKALVIAQQNNMLHKTKVQCFRHDILMQQPPNIKANIIVSNPPYVTQAEKQSMDKNVKDYEPASALFVSNEDPLIFYRKILQNTKNNRSDSGTWYYFEINENLGNEMIDLLKKEGLNQIALKKDIHQRNRMIRGFIK